MRSQVATDTDEQQLVVCVMGSEKLAFDISYVQSIVRVPTITQVPGMPEYMEGIINLRGSILPVMDLGIRLNKKPVARSEATRIIVLELEAGSVGVLVDAVSQVTRFSNDDVETELSSTCAADNVLAGIARQEESLVIIIDPTQLVSGLDIEFDRDTVGDEMTTKRSLERDVSLR